MLLFKLRSACTNQSAKECLRTQAELRIHFLSFVGLSVPATIRKEDERYCALGVLARGKQLLECLLGAS